MDSPYGGSTASLLGIPPHQKALRARTPPPPVIRTLEATGSGSAYSALRFSSVKRRRIPGSEFSWTRPRRRSLLMLCLALISLCVLTVYCFSDFFVLLRFKLRNKMYEDGYIHACYLRKKPMLFVRGDNELAIVWESNCEREMQLRWRGRGQWENARIKRVHVNSRTRFVYQAVLRGLEADIQNYTYEIRQSNSNKSADDDDGSTTPSESLSLARHSFQWTAGNPKSLDIAVLADNQFNVRSFHRILQTMLTYFRRHTSHRRPNFIIHAGDQVQNPHNLAQWQTDFWDAMTSHLSMPLGQTTPMLLARGNHDWDKTGENAYTGGSPPRLDWLAVHGRKPRERHVGTYMSYSPHSRCRIIVLDSNLDELEQVEQEEWLEWELGRKEWTRATLRIVVVHVPPFLEYWDRHNWADGKESEWYVQRISSLSSGNQERLKLIAILSTGPCMCDIA